MKPYKAVALLALGLMPLFAFPGMLFRECWEVVSIYGACAAFALWLRSWWYRLFMLMAVAMLLRYPVSVSFYQIVMIVIFLSAANSFLRETETDLMAAVRIAAIGMAALVALQSIGIVPKFSGRATAFFNPDAAGVFFAVCMPAFLTRQHWPGAILMAGCVFISGTTTGFAALAASACVFAALLRPRRALHGLFGITALFAAWDRWIDPVFETITNPRWTAWKHILWSFRSEMFGRGIGSFRETFNYFILNDPNIPHNWICAHNEYLQAGYEFGIQMMILNGAFLICFAATVWLNRGRLTLQEMQIAAGVTAVAVSCLGWFTFHIPPLAIVSVAWISMWLTPKTCEVVK